MSTAPTGNTVARARYWLAAASRIVGLVLLVIEGPRVVAIVVGCVIAMVSGDSLGEMIRNVWDGYGAGFITFVAGASLFWFARPIAAAIAPLVKPVCPRCGYPRSGLLAADPCPECGTRTEPDGAQPVQQRPRRAGEGA